MQDIIDFINRDRETIIKNAVGWLKYNYPSRTSSYDKCSRDINFVLDAYVKDIKNRSICNIINVASKYWKDGERQIVDYEAELAVHQFIINFICETVNVNDDNRKFLAFLRNILMNVITKGINTDNSNTGHLI